MKRQTYSEMATQGVRALWEKKKFTLRELGAEAGIPTSSAHRVVQGQQPVTLAILQAVEKLTETNALELLVDPSDALKLVNPMEAQILRFVRSWPAPTRAAFIAFASFFADEPPATADARRAHEQLRRLPDAKQRLAYAYLTFLTEGDLPPDIARALELQAITAPPVPRTKTSK